MNIKFRFVLLGILMVAGCGTPNKVYSPVEAKAAEPADRPKAFKEESEFKVDCHFEGQAVSVRFKDRKVSLMLGETEIQTGLSPALYRQADSQSSFPSICDGVPAYKVDDTQQVLFIFNLDQKPDFPETSVILFDFKTKRVLNKTERIGKLKSLESPRYNVIPAQDGYQMRLIRDAKNLAEDWKWIVIKKGRLTTRWMTSGKKKADY